MFMQLDKASRVRLKLSCREYAERIVEAIGIFEEVGTE